MNVSHASVHPVEDAPTTEGGNAPRARMKDMQGMPGTLGGLVLRISQFLFAAAALIVMATTSDFPSVTAFWMVLLLLSLLIFPSTLEDHQINYSWDMKFGGIGMSMLLHFMMSDLPIVRRFDIWTPVLDACTLVNVKYEDFDLSTQVLSLYVILLLKIYLYLVAAAGLQCFWSISLAIVDIYALLVGRSLQNHQVVSLFTIGDGMTSTLTFAAACASAGITVLIDNDLGSCGHNHCAQFETATAMAFITWFTSLPSFLLNFWSLASR
ncbi:hypothetical protein FEM48_Zijuj02G0095200 [Ziziphus jujuba var. spinosa]|uniref:CASP-like protein n=1 Tax=Ziziphus jujuba var. spinosa TaxID=714518 RepID=A0A978VUZ1_ZIZJJ|nr:hypothetical protein FEM48_Zijuj02G0095200 [Ziziphus jujuba var. spinosa]